MDPNGLLCNRKGQVLGGLAPSFRSCLDRISDVATPCSFHQSGHSPAKIDYERSGAVPLSLVSYEGDWQQVSQAFDEETGCVLLL